jgi:hypothetical protein
VNPDLIERIPRLVPDTLRLQVLDAIDAEQHRTRNSTGCASICSPASPPLVIPAAVWRL